MRQRDNDPNKWLRISWIREKGGRFVFEGGLDAKKIPNYEQKFWQNHLKANLIDMFTREISITANGG